MPLAGVATHPIHRRFHVEDLVRLRRASEQRRYLASQRAGRVDPNPHQIDAVIFALQRISQGGCILADEVGLGKTIEAGLVIAQLRAEGAQRVLLITPKPLLGQWKEELVTLFGIEAIEGHRGREDGSGPRGFEGPGVFIVGREQAGSERGAQMLQASGGFDLCVIDEAHEIFAGIYRRFDRHGQVKARSRYAKTAARVRTMLGQTPVLLLTATPIQNTLTELWGLVQYVEPTGTLLGDLPTFRTLFCEGDDRSLRPGQGDELRRRIAAVCQRTLRRQAEAFMERKFTRRTARLFEYAMSALERALYDDVTEYLLDPKTVAFRGNHRRLLLIGFHRRMASSIRALASSLETVAARLQRRLAGRDDATLEMFATDLEEDDDEPAATDRDEGPPATDEVLRAELQRVQSLADRARALRGDAKAEQLLEAVRFVRERERRGDGTGKVVIFTEALTTQDYLRELLIDAGLAADSEITLFRGSNAGARAAEALSLWEQEVGSKMPEASRPSKSVATRLALVHEFKTRSRIFISTEAGAKGLNLQFCETVVNYDLPWNPQRIEQRIGRCHRYGQERDVVVINFLSGDNEAQRRTFEILSRKLDLFGTVLSASDAVLYEPSEQAPELLVGALGSDFEMRLQQIYERARSKDEIEQGLEQLEQHMGQARVELEEARVRTSGLIETRLDETVRAAFNHLEDEIPEALATFDRELEGVATRYLDAVGARYQRLEDGGIVRLVLAPDPRLPAGLREGLGCAIGPAPAAEELQSLHLGHPLVRAAVDEARRSSRGRFRVRLQAPAALRSALEVAGVETAGVRGRLAVLKVCYDGFEPVHELLPLVVLENSDIPLLAEQARALVVCAMEDLAADPGADIDDDALQDAIDEALFVARGEIEDREQGRFEDTIARLERYMDDRVMVVRRSRLELLEQLRDAQARRDAAVGADARTRAEAECAELQSEVDACESEIVRLLDRRDDDFQTWRARAHERRYAPVRLETIIDAEFVLE